MVTTTNLGSSEIIEAIHSVLRSTRGAAAAVAEIRDEKETTPTKKSGKWKVESKKAAGEEEDGSKQETGGGGKYCLLPTELTSPSTAVSSQEGCRSLMICCLRLFYKHGTPTEFHKKLIWLSNSTLTLLDFSVAQDSILVFGIRLTNGQSFALLKDRL